MITLNKTLATILVYAADDIQKYQKMQKLIFFKKIIKISHEQKIKCLVFFKSERRVCNNLNVNSIKAALKTLNFFKKLIFAFLNIKVVNLKKTQPKYRLTSVHRNAHI